MSFEIPQRFAPYKLEQNGFQDDLQQGKNVE